MEKNTAPSVSQNRKKQSMIHRTDEHFMRLALKEAENAFNENEIPVGAVLVKENRVIAVSHNKRETNTDPTAHAEVLVLREGASKIKDWRLTDMVLYVTKEPCVMCAGAMVNARLGRLVYGCKDSRYGAVISRYQIGSDSRLNHKIEVTPGILERECSDIMKRFFKKLRQVCS
jgi:tRNA(adenine34) deaminase